MINDHVRLAATAAAINADSGTLYHLASDLMEEGVPFDVILFDLLVGVEKDVGARWQQGDYLVPEEHAATATVETVVSILAGMFDQPSQGMRVVVATAEGDEHSLPARMIAAYLLFLGFRTSFLGANVLAADMAEFLEADTSDALVLSCAMSNHLIGARKVIRAAHEAGVPVLVGGRAFGESGEWAGLVGADAWTEDLRQVPEVLESWNPNPADAEVGAVEFAADLVDLRRRRSSVLAAAEDAMTGDSSDRLTAELALLLGAVEASLLVEDDRLITEMLDWQDRTLRAHGYEASLVDALETALEHVSPRAAAAPGGGAPCRGQPTTAPSRRTRPGSAAQQPDQPIPSLVAEDAHHLEFVGDVGNSGRPSTLLWVGTESAPFRRRLRTDLSSWLAAGSRRVLNNSGGRTLPGVSPRSEDWPSRLQRMARHPSSLGGCAGYRPRSSSSGVEPPGPA